MTDEPERMSRCAGAQDDREEQARALFGAWPIPRDTYITDGFPMLLYKLSKIPSPPTEPNAD